MYCEGPLDMHGELADLETMAGMFYLVVTHGAPAAPEPGVGAALIEGKVNEREWVLTHLGCAMKELAGLCVQHCTSNWYSALG